MGTEGGRPPCQPDRLTAAEPASTLRHFRRRPHPPPRAQSPESPRTPPPGDWNAGHVATRGRKREGRGPEFAQSERGRAGSGRLALATSLATRGAGGSAGRAGRRELREGGGGEGASAREGEEN